MKRLAILLALACAAALASDRVPVPVACGSCHIPHRAQGEVSDATPPDQPRASMCLSCHDGQFVSNPHLTGEPIPVRSNPQSPFSQTNTAAPRFMSVNLSEAERQNCTTCHEPHSAHFAEKKGTTLPSYHQSMKDNTRCVACHKAT